MEKNKVEVFEQEELDLYKLFTKLWKYKFFIITFTLISSLLSLGISLNLPNIYTSSAVLAPEKSGNNNFSQYSGLAGMAGISLPTETDLSTEAIGRIQSYDFFLSQIIPHINFEDLMAVKTWDYETNTLNYDKKIFNAEEKKWVRNNKNAKPTSQEAYIVYKDIMTVSEDIKTKFVTLSIDHKSPYIAEKWVSLIIKSINDNMRSREKDLIIKSTAFLEQQLKKVNYEGVKKSISNLQEDQIKQLMTVEAKEDYVFKIIDSPYAPELKSRPKRLQICIIGFVVGLVISIFLSIIYSDIKRRIN